MENKVLDGLDRNFNSVLTSAHIMLALVNNIIQMCQSNKDDHPDVLRLKMAIQERIAIELKSITHPQVN